MVKKILNYLVYWRILTLIFAFLASFLIPLATAFNPYPHLKAKLPYYVWIWANFDGAHYLKIADWGYRQYEQPFFPLFPILIRVLAEVYHLPYLISGLFISHLSTILALFIIIKLLIIDDQKDKINLFLIAILLFPTSFFYGSVYNDSLFLFLSSLTILLARKKKWIATSVAGSLATLTRLNGLALFIFILFEYISNKLNFRETWNLKKLILSFKLQVSAKKILGSRILFVILIPTVFIGYLIYNQIAFGHWTLLFKAMVVWHQEKLVFPLQVFWRYAKILFINSPNTLIYWVAVMELSFVFFYIFILIYSFKKIRFSYWLFVAISLLIPSLTGTFAGMPRYGLHLYPLFLGLTFFLDHQKKIVKLLYFVLSLVILFLCLALFTRGYFIA